ncbi:phosphatidylglycerophosphatase A [Gammaproteobacteria bacterium]|nr:phosphatidylglycerophosphatase A [Gammaproteobacteria bacterium]
MWRSKYGIATWFGLGNIPIAPGTFGSMGAIPLAYLLVNTSLLVQLSTFIFVLGISFYAAHIYGKQIGDSDHRSIVCDEVSGLLWVLLLVAPSHWWLAFIIFRGFDILKPWPICWLDRALKGALGCMLDDLLAGVMTYISLLLLVGH